MRAVELGRTAAQAELLRFKRSIRRQAMRGVWGAVAAVFAIAVLVMVHVIAFQLLLLAVPPIWAAVILLAVDCVFLAIFASIALRSMPDRIETEARELRDRALVEMREAMAVTALVSPVGRVVVRSAGRGLVGALTPGFMRRRRR